MPTKHIVILLAVLASLALPSMAMAHPRHPRHRHHAMSHHHVRARKADVEEIAQEWITVVSHAYEPLMDAEVAAIEAYEGHTNGEPHTTPLEEAMPMEPEP